MKNALLGMAASLLQFALGLLPMAGAQAAELQVLAGGAMTTPMKELAARFEKTSGHKLIIRFGTTPELIRMVTTGGPFDLAVVPVDVFRDTAARAQVAPGPTLDIARVGLGVAVRSGARKPDIGTPDALKRALLTAQSISTIPASAAGTQVMRAFDALGISDELRAKIRPQPGPAQVVQSVASGDVELAVFLINVLTAPGLEVVGPFPAELQQEVVFTAAIAVDARQVDAARAFLRYLTTSEAAEVIKASGMTPG
jgi:molybdate transport system substrate-binding protein